MNEVIFDIRQTSIISWTAYVVSVLTYVTASFLFYIITKKLKEQNRLQRGVIAVPLVMLVILGVIIVAFFVRRSQYINILDRGQANIIAGEISNIKTGKVEYVSVDSLEFSLSGFAEITPAFTTKGILNQGQKVTIYYYRDDILRLELW
jgi:hypothetical protein